MKPILLGIAGPSVMRVGNLLDHSARIALKPFAEVLHAVADSFSAAPAENTIEKEPSGNHLAEQLLQTLTAIGISIDEPIELTLSDNKLVVLGDHPQRTLIEAALAQHPALVEEVNDFLLKQAGVSDLSETNPKSLPSKQPGSILLSTFSGQPRLESTGP